MEYLNWTYISHNKYEKNQYYPIYLLNESLLWPVCQKINFSKPYNFFFTNSNLNFSNISFYGTLLSNSSTYYNIWLHSIYTGLVYIVSSSHFVTFIINTSWYIWKNNSFGVEQQSLWCIHSIAICHAQKCQCMEIRKAKYL